MGFDNCEVGFGKKMNWEMGLVALPPSGPFSNSIGCWFAETFCTNLQ